MILLSILSSIERLLFIITYIHTHALHIFIIENFYGNSIEEEKKIEIREASNVYF